MTQTKLLPPPRAMGKTRAQRIDALVADLERLGQRGSSADGIAWRWSLLGIEVDDLRHARRQYAMRHHSDLAQTDDARAEATRKLSRANALLDVAIAEAKNA